MTRRAVRVTLLIVFLAAMGVTAYLFRVAEREAGAIASGARAFDDSCRASIVQIADLRGEQQAYVAVGQGDDFWISRTASLLDDLKAHVSTLKTEATAPDARYALEEAFGALQDFEQMDGRARSFARGRQIMLASDLIFSDGLELTRKMAAAVDRARAAEQDARDAAFQSVRQRELFSIGAAAAAATLIVLLLVPSGRRELDLDSLPVAARPRTMPETNATVLDDLLSPEEGWRPARPAVAAAAAIDDKPAPPPAAAASAPQPPAPAPVPAPSVDLPAIASLCSELARVADTQALPAILERAASLLDAAGVVLWVADPDVRELAPIIAHGYPASLVTRLSTIPRDADNATAAAFRTGLLQTVNSDGSSNGAVAAPLVTPGGCVGVMAAEVRNAGERQEGVLAAANIVAAQLATLIGPPATRTKAEVAG